MKRSMEAGILLVLILLFAGLAQAQANEFSGQVWDFEGKPYANLDVDIKSTATGRTFHVKTDKDGKFSQLGVPNGDYTITLTGPQLPAPGYSTPAQIGAQRGPFNINLKEIAGAVSAKNPDALAFQNMKVHFQAATAAMNDAETLRKTLSTATADQKADLNSKLGVDYQTALTEYTAAEQGVTAKDAVNHALIWAQIGRVNDFTMKYGDAATAYQKAIDLKPMPDYYSDLSTALVNDGAAQRDPAVLQQKLSDAAAACEKAISAATAPPAPGTAPEGGSSGPSVGARCYKNMGIVLTNKSDLKDALGPLQKASAANPKDAQIWYLLGGAYTGMIGSKTVDGKEVFDIPPGTIDAFQKCVDADPNGPLAGQCKEMIDNVNQMSGGVSTTIGSDPGKKNSKKKNN